MAVSIFFDTVSNFATYLIYQNVSFHGDPKLLSGNASFLSYGKYVVIYTNT